MKGELTEQTRLTEPLLGLGLTETPGLTEPTEGWICLGGGLTEPPWGTGCTNLKGVATEQPRLTEPPLGQDRNKLGGVLTEPPGLTETPGLTEPTEGWACLGGGLTEPPWGTG